jgi:type IV secretion system protein VirB6
MDISIRPTNFINDLLNAVDTLTAHFVERGYQAISHNIIVSGLLTSILVLYIVYQLSLVYYEQAPFSGIANHIVKVSLVFILALNWDVFHRVIYNFVTNEPMHLSKLLIDAYGTNSGTSSASLNDVWVQGMDVITSIFKNSPFSIKGFFISFYSVMLVFMSTLLFTLIALGYIVLAKFFVAIYLAIAPYFILMYLFRGTQGLTQAWVQSLLNYALIPVFVSVVLLFTMSLAVVLLEPMVAQDAEGGPTLVGAAMYANASIIAAYITYLIPHKAAALTSSLSMGALSQLAAHAKGNLGKINTAYQGAKGGAGRIKNGLGSAAKTFNERQQNLKAAMQARKEAFKKKSNPHIHAPGVGFSKIDS